MDRKFKTFIHNGIVPCYQDYDPEYLISGDSVAGDSEIILSGGMRVRIDSLFKKTEYTLNEKEYYIPENVSTLTYDESNNRSCYKPVKYIMRHKVSKKVFRVWVNNDTYVDVTEDHSLIGYVNTYNRKKGQSILKELKPEEAKGNSLISLKYVPRDVNNLEDSPFPLKVHELMGFFIGDGHMEKGNISISFGLDVQECIDEIVNPLIKLGYISSYTVRKNGYDVRIYGDITKIIKEYCIDVTGNKVIPENFLERQKEDVVSAFIRGYFSADGGTMKRGNTSIIRLSSINKEFLKSTRRMLFLLGVPSSVFNGTTENKYGGKQTKTKTTSSYLIIKDNDRFKQKVGFCLDRKHNSILPNGLQTTSLSHYDFSLSTISKIEEIQYNDYVYDIEVEDTHTFFANDILVHNTDSTYIDLSEIFNEQSTKEEVCEFADYIGDKTNESFPQFMKDVFNVSDERSDVIQTEREVVADKAYFLAKKMYVMHVVNSEGVDEDKLKIMGVAIKKTDTNKLVQDMLRDLVEMLMDRKPYEEIRDFIETFKLDYHQKHISEIGRPISLKSYHKYEQEYLRTKSFKGVPYHIKAALFYNSLCSLNDRTLGSGDKAQIVYVKHYKNNAIAVPVEGDVLPEFLNELTIDWNRQWKTVEEKINAFLIPIGYDKKSRQKQKTNTLLKY